MCLKLTSNHCPFFQLAAPRISILDEREAAVSEKFYKWGSTIALTCRVERVVGRRPEYIIWHHEDRMLNYDTERGGIRHADYRSNYQDLTLALFEMSL